MRTLQDTILQNQQNHTIFRSTLPVFLSNQTYKAHNKQDEQQCSKLMKTMISFQPQLGKKLDQILEQVNNKDFNSGIGYYNSKNLLLMEYLIQLQFYQIFKVNGQDLTSGQGLQLYKRLAFLKTLLTKLSPVQKKLEYQKNKLLKYSDVIHVKADTLNAQENDQNEDDLHQQSDIQQEDQEKQESNQNMNNQSDEEDALMYQPRPQALMGIKKAKKKQQEIQGKYIAPKISAVLSKQDKSRRRLQIKDIRKKAHFIRQIYRDDIQDDEEARQTGVNSAIAQRIKQKFRQKTAIEQQNFMRFPDTKKQKMWKKSLIRKHERSNPLYDDLKKIQTIKQIFTERKEDDKIIEAKVTKRRKEDHKPLKGGKKRKMQ